MGAELIKGVSKTTRISCRPRGHLHFGIFELALAILPEDDPAALVVLPVPKVIGRP